MNSTGNAAGRLPLRHADAGTRPDAEADVVVVGSGAAGFAAAITAAGRGLSAIVLEKGDRVGGTTRKSGAWSWIPNNRFLREAGTVDDRQDALRYMARLARPELYDADAGAGCFGLPARDFALLEAFYDHAAEAVEALEAHGALRLFHADFIPDYYAQLPENKTPSGRVVMPLADNGEPGEGEEMITQLAAGADRLGVDVRCGHRVAQVLLNRADEVVGVVAEADGGPVTVRARRAVVFASGGFGQSPELRRSYLAGPIFGSCTALTNTGDFLPIASALGAPLDNMSYPWLGPCPLERGLRNRPDSWLMFEPAGDSMFMVDRYGRRFVDEKIQYNEITQTMWRWDPSRAEYPSLFPVMIWDQASQDRWQGDKWGNPIAPAGQDDGHVVHGDTLEELAEAVRERLHRLRDRTGGYTLDDGFERRLAETFHRFNEHAAAHTDPDFGRGGAPISLFFQSALGPPRDGNEDNPVLHPLAERGPYHATILAPGTLDTKGGPRTNADAQVLDRTGAPIPGLYGAGNCVASVSGKAYFAGGATIGPALTFGYLAALAAAREPVRELADTDVLV
ncbi:MAG TPA: FAD-dependent oxidoreductase [Pseudonocardia sp.]|jgi:succinate dehydrogenase/fumarate reductase flavoprotein subunit